MKNMLSKVIKKLIIFPLKKQGRAKMTEKAHY